MKHNLIKLLIHIWDSYIRWNLRFNSWLHPFTKPQSGITLVGHLSGAWSFGKVMRDLAFSLKQAGIPFQTYNTGLRHDIPSEDLRPILTPRRNFNARRFNHVIEIIDSQFPNVPGIQKWTGFFWEFDTGCQEAWPNMARKQKIIAFSDYNLQMFSKSFPAVPVRKLLYPFRFDTMALESVEAIRRRFHIPLDAFTVFFNFNYYSGVPRKNPEGVIQATARAFRNCSDVRLVFKTMRAKECPDKVSRIYNLIKEENLADRFISIDSYMSQRDIYSLTNACDAYISLHRGEGFGLGIAEAMSLGKPVVVTNYSSTTEFCNEHNSMLIPFQMVKPKAEDIDYEPFKNVTEWPEPDIEIAAQALRKLYDHPEMRTQLGVAAKASIARQFSNENFRQSIEEFLDS